MLAEFVQDGDFVVWRLGIADSINVGLKTSANWIRLLIFLDFEIWRYPEIACKMLVF